MNVRAAVQRQAKYLGSLLNRGQEQPVGTEIVDPQAFVPAALGNTGEPARVSS